MGKEKKRKLEIKKWTLTLKILFWKEHRRVWTSASSDISNSPFQKNINRTRAGGSSEKRPGEWKEAGVKQSSERARGKIGVIGDEGITLCRGK